MKVRVYSDINVPRILASRGLSEHSPTARRFIASEVARLCDPYVPFYTGFLKSHHTIATDGRTLTYDAPYAKTQYYNNKGGRNGPLRGPLWEKRMLADKRDALAQSVDAYIKGGGRT